MRLCISSHRKRTSMRYYLFTALLVNLHDATALCADIQIVLVVDDTRHKVLVRQVLPVRQLCVRCEYYDDGEQCGDDGILVHDLSFCKNERTKPFIGLVGAKLAIISRLPCVFLHLF